MKKVFKVWLLAAVTVGSLSFSAWVQAASFFDESFGNYQEELEVAKENDKQGIFIFFHMEECPFCHRMRTTIMTEPDVIKLFKKHFLTFEVDIEGSNEVTDFDGTVSTAQDMSEKKYRVRATPVMMIFDLDGKPILKYTGPTRTKEEFKWLADYVVDGAYEQMSFTKYKRQQKRAARE
ncbi:MAG: thioredoxin fold domain-containing protein [Thiomicrorhabdus chilensis]|uniref:thioredoxin family protein n=1 Tax=Thiomicrorhabdus chilensis TaxID=63656 RepID=UPI00299F11FA|nr:thioredoxin fold domain-containing protein [Thiomicrorhabdus chilensis]MDX1347006.1 thioredoxin fold domain-containing protein [Thiomicrorhabdus chilensis]